MVHPCNRAGSYETWGRARDAHNVGDPKHEALGKQSDLMATSVAPLTGQSRQGNTIGSDDPSAVARGRDGEQVWVIGSKGAGGNFQE